MTCKNNPARALHNQSEKKKDRILWNITHARTHAHTHTHTHTHTHDMTCKNNPTRA